MNLTFDQMVIACRNIGYDLRCGACAELFYTGARMNPHDAGCTTVKENAPPVTASNHTPVIVSATATTPATGEDRWVGLYAGLLDTAARIEKERDQLLVAIKKAEFDRDVAKGMVGAIVEGSDSWKADCEELRKELAAKDAELEALRECDTCDGGGTFYLDGEPQDCVCMEPFAEKLAKMREEHEATKAELAKLKGEPPAKGTKIVRSKNWWLARADSEGDSPIAAGVLWDEPDVMGAGIGHQVARKVEVIKRLGEQIKRQKIHNAMITGRLAAKKEVIAQLYVILQEARDNALASTVESGVSDSRLDYRKGLVERMDAILIDKHWGKRSANYILMLEGLLSYVALIHPLPWTIENDWTTEVHDGKGEIIVKYQTVKEAETLIEAGIKLGEEAKKRHDEVEAMLKADAEEESKS